MKYIGIKFDELVAPKAPYSRHRVNVATLAMAEAEPEPTTSETQIPIPENMAIPPIEEEVKPEITPSPEERLAEAIEEAVDAMKAKGESAKTGLSAPVDEVDAAKQEEVKQKIDEAVNGSVKSIEERYAEIKKSMTPADLVVPEISEPEKPTMKEYPSGHVIIPPGSKEYEELQAGLRDSSSQESAANEQKAEHPNEVGDVRVTKDSPEYEDIKEMRRKLQAEEMEKKNRELEAENAALKAQLAEKEKAQADAGSQESTETEQELPSQESEKPGSAQEGIKDVIKQILSKEKKHLELKIISDAHNLSRWWHSVLAKRSQDLLAKREARVQQIEDELAKFASKSWIHTAVAPLRPKRWFSLNIYRSARERSVESLAYHESERRRHEEARAGYIDVVASSMDAARESNEGRKAEYEKYIAELDEYIIGLYEQHKDLTMRYGSMSDVPEKLQVFDEQKAILKEINESVAAKSEAQKVVNQYAAVAGDLLSKQNGYLDMKVLVNQPDTSAKPRRRAKTGAPPKKTSEKAAA